MTDLLDARTGAFYAYTSVTNRYLIGPAVEVKLPFDLGVELDALYRRFRYTVAGCKVYPYCSNGRRVTGNAWEFPLLAKYRFRSGIVRPYLDAGIAWDAVTGANADHGVVTGFVTGGGLEVRAGHLHISPEVRYTRWFSQHFTNTSFEYGILGSNQNQAEFLLGLSF
jgi:hypothetical protein